MFRPANHRLGATAPRARRARLPVLAAVLGGTLCACATPIRPDTCDIDAVRIAHWRSEPGRFDVAVEVEGRAGVEGRAWLGAQVGPQRWTTGDYVRVGPGAFRAEVDMKLTGRPGKIVAVLRVGERRCKDEVETPD